MTDRDRSSAVDLGSMTFLTEEANRDRRRLRVGLLAAIALHLVVFAITWPNMVRDARACLAAWSSPSPASRTPTGIRPSAPCSTGAACRAPTRGTR